MKNTEKKQPSFLRIFLATIIVYLSVIIVVEYMVGRFFISYISDKVETKRKEEMLIGWKEYLEQKKLEHKNKVIGYSWWTEIGDAFEENDMETILNQDFEGDPALIKDCDVFLAVDKDFKLITACIDGIKFQEDSAAIQKARDTELEKDFFKQTEDSFKKYMTPYIGNREAYKKIGKVISKPIIWNYIIVYNGSLRLLTLTPICTNQGYPLTKGFMLYGEKIERVKVNASKIIPADIDIGFQKPESSYLNAKVAGIENDKDVYVTFDPHFKITDIIGNILLLFIIGQVILLTIAISLIFPFFTRRYTRNLEDTVIERTHELNIKNYNLQAANVEITGQKAEIEAQRDEITSQRDVLFKQKDAIDQQQKEIVKAFKESSKQQVQLHKAMLEISEQKKQITDSIQYAKRIQSAILPPDEFIKKLLPECFVLYKPKDIVSGDFYWLTKKNGKIVFAVGDCTGHGVPGAFMSIIGVNSLNEIVIEKGISQPAEILNALRDKIIQFLHQSDKPGESKDGMDIALCSIDPADNTIEFAGANNPLYIVPGLQSLAANQQAPVSDIIEIKPDKMPIGIYAKMDVPFTNHRTQVKPGDTIYLFTDGYPDQFGDETGKKLKYKRFRHIISEIKGMDMHYQREILNNTIEEWKGVTEQIDDILVVGIRF